MYLYKIIDGKVSLAVLNIKVIENFGDAVIYQTVEKVLQVDFIDSFIFLCVIDSKNYLLEGNNVVFGEHEYLQEVIQFNRLNVA